MRSNFEVRLRVGRTPPAPNYDIGWLSGEQSRKAIGRLMGLIKGDYLGEDLAKQAKKIALERSPGCQAVWPETAE